MCYVSNPTQSAEIQPKSTFLGGQRLYARIITVELKRKAGHTHRCWQCGTLFHAPEIEQWAFYWAHTNAGPGTIISITMYTTSTIPSYRWDCSSLILQTDALHLVGDAMSASINEQWNISTTVVYSQLPALVTSREDIKTTPKGNISGFSKYSKLMLLHREKKSSF